MKRILVAIPTLVFLTLVVFSMVKAVPGDPALLLLGDRATAASLATVRQELGLDKPWYVQYGTFLKNLVVSQDLGRSIRSHEPVSKLISEKFPATIELAIAAMLISTIVGIPMGFLSALFPTSLIDFLSMGVAVLGVSIPVFWLGLMLIWLFGMQLDLLPLSGRLGIEMNYEPVSGFLFVDAIRSQNWEIFWDGLKHIILPALTLGTIPMAIIARMTRSAMLDVLKQDFVRTAFAKGVLPKNVYLKHALRNAALPILTVLGLQFGLLLGGAIITETVFSWPGIGSWLLESVSSRDYPSIQGGVLIVATAFVLVNIAVDLMYRFIDPRVRVT